MQLKQKYIIPATLLGFAFLILQHFNLHYGEINQDEGWYLYISKMIHNGASLYRDVAYTQGPVLPTVYGFLIDLFKIDSVFDGRLLNLSIQLLANIVFALTVYFWAPKHKRVFYASLALVLFVLNVYQNYYTTLVKTYSLSNLLSALSLLFFILSQKRALKWNDFLLLLAGFFAVATVANRSSLLPLPAFSLLFLMLSGKAALRQSFFYFSGGCLAFASFYLPALMANPENFFFFNLHFHQLREAENGLLYKVGFISRMVQNYFLLSAMSIVIGFLHLRRFLPLRLKSKWEYLRPRRDRGLFLLFLSISLACTFIHFSAPFPYDDYQSIVMVFWVLTLVLAYDSVSGLPGRLEKSLIFYSVFIIAIGSSFSSPINQQWFQAERDRIWFKVKEQSSLEQLGMVSEKIKALMPQGENTLLTQDTYLAFQSGLNIPPAYAMGPFSFFPDWSNEECEKRNVINAERIISDIESGDFPVLALSEYSFAISSPQIEAWPETKRQKIWERIDENYNLVETISPFGQAGTLLRLYSLKK